MPRGQGRGSAQPLHTEEKGNGGFKLRPRQEQHLEVEEGLLVHRGRDSLEGEEG